MSIYRASKGVKNKNGKTWDPTRNKTKKLIKDSESTEKERASLEDSGAYRVDNYRNTPEK